MKTYCKHSRITEPAFVRDCIERFLNGKRSRRDVNDFLSRHPDLDSLSWQIADEIGRGEYGFAPIRYFRRYARNPTSLRLAYRCASYYGWLKNSDSIQYRRRSNVDQIVRRARNTVAASRKKG